MDNIVYVRIKKLCENNNTNIAALERDLELSNGVISKWKKATPNVETLRKVANYFNTSLDYLIGMTDIITPVKEIIADENFRSIQRARETMDDEEEERMMQLLKLSFAKNFAENQ